MDFKNKVVIITGASSGIGAACAIKLASLNANICLVGRRECKLMEIKEKCGKYQQKHQYVVADITNDEDVKKIVNETVNFFGKIDVLINNAGKTSLTSIDGSIADYDDTMATNIRGPYLLSKLVMPHLIKSKGNIINMSSILSVHANSALTNYSISKAALDMMTKCFASHYAPAGVRVNSVNPGPVPTEIFKKAGMDDETNEALFKEFTRKMPLGVVSECEDIAELVAFIASDKAKTITGSCHFIDSGMLLGENMELRE